MDIAKLESTNMDPTITSRKGGFCLATPRAFVPVARRTGTNARICSGSSGQNIARKPGHSSWVFTQTDQRCYVRHVACRIPLIPICVTNLDEYSAYKYAASPLPLSS